MTDHTPLEVLADRVEVGPVFVFGSNLAGRHGAGAAKFARDRRGAQYGVGEGRTGNAYAIPTKDGALRVLAVDEIAFRVRRFIRYARDNPGILFQVTPIGCGLAGYSPAQIAPLFEGAPSNCQFRDERDRDWRPARATDHDSRSGDTHDSRVGDRK